MKKIIILLLLLASPCFANAKALLPKDDQALPDNYSITVYYLTGGHEIFELASHELKDGILSFWTKDDICSWVVISNVKRIEFDKNFSKMIAIKAKLDKKK